MIVVFSHAHPSISKGGAEVSAYTLYLGLRRLGVPAAFVAMVPEQEAHRLVLDTPDEHAIAYRAEHYDHLFHHAEPPVFEAARRIVEPLRPKALVFHHFLFLGVNTVRRLREGFGCPAILVLHEFLAICHHHGQMVTHPQKKLCDGASATRCASCFPAHAPEEFHLRRIAFADTLLGMDWLVSPSAFLAQRFAAWGARPGQLRVIENGLAGHGQPGHAPADAAPARADARAVVFGYFGQINPFKGVDLILDALERLGKPDDAESPRIVVRVHGNIVGVSDEFKAALDKAVKAGRVDFHGPYDNADVLALMGRCDYVVMASKWWENSPVVIQEAFSARRPLLAPGIGGMAEKIPDGVAGRHFRFNDAADLARVLRACARETADGTAAYTFPVPSKATDMARAYLALLEPLPVPA